MSAFESRVRDWWRIREAPPGGLDPGLLASQERSPTLFTTSRSPARGVRTGPSRSSPPLRSETSKACQWSSGVGTFVGIQAVPSLPPSMISAGWRRSSVDGMATITPPRPSPRGLDSRSHPSKRREVPTSTGPCPHQAVVVGREQASSLVFVEAGEKAFFSCDHTPGKVVPLASAAHSPHTEPPLPAPPCHRRSFVLCTGHRGRRVQRRNLLVGLLVSTLVSCIRAQ